MSTPYCGTWCFGPSDMTTYTKFQIRFTILMGSFLPANFSSIHFLNFNIRSSGFIPTNATEHSKPSLRSLLIPLLKVSSYSQGVLCFSQGAWTLLCNKPRTMQPGFQPFSQSVLFSPALCQSNRMAPFLNLYLLWEEYTNSFPSQNSLALNVKDESLRTDDLELGVICLTRQ